MNKARICILYPSIAKESAEKLADSLGWDAVNPFKTNRRDFRDYAGVFNYGCNRKIYARNVINKAQSVATCVDKVATFKALQQAGVPIPAYTTNKAAVPAAWDTVVVRKEVNGARAEGLEYVYQYNGERPQAGALFTEYFEHTSEFRIMVFLGKVVGCYRKVSVDDQWQFVQVRNIKHQQMHDDAVKAAKALDIDYVGFDVLRNKKGEYKFLEANSACILTEEMIDAIKKYL